jgi:aspartate/methionine/tyrosine aminotransferase
VAKYYFERTKAVAEGLNNFARKHGLIEPICVIPKATFYVWADFSACAGVNTDLDIFECFLQRGVAVIPGSDGARAEDGTTQLCSRVDD